MWSMYPLIFSLLILTSCGSHTQVGEGVSGVSNTSQITNPDSISQYVLDENIPEIEKFFKNGGDINFELKSGRTLLTEACFWSKKKMILFLVKHQADVQLKDRLGKSATDYAEENREIKFLIFPELLLEQKKTIFNQVKNNLLNDLKKTLEDSPNLNFIITSAEFGEDAISAEGETLLTFIVKNKLENVLRLLAQPKFALNVNMKNAKDESPLKLAIELDYKNIEKVLLKLGATE